MKNRTWKLHDDDVIFDMMRMFNNLKSVFQPLHDEMTRDYNMTVSQLQWLPEWKSKLLEEGRPANAYNLLRPVINIITAIELANRKKIIAKPTQGGEAKMAEIITQVLLRFMHNTKFDWHRTRVLLDSIIAKYGVYNIGWTYEYDPEGELDITAVDPRRLMFEMNFADPTWEKASYIYDKHQLSIEEILNKFALDDEEMQNAIIEEGRIFFMEDTEKRDRWVSKRLKALFTAVYEIVMHGDRHTGSQSMNNAYLNWFDPVTGKFDVLELHEKRIERRLIVWDRNRQKNIDITEESKNIDDKSIGFDNEKIDDLKQKYDIDGEPRTTLDSQKFITTVIPAFQLKVNEQPYPFKLRGYTYVPNYCYDYHAEPFRSQSVIDDLIDPQSDYNKARSTKLELLQRYVNRGWIMDENAIIGVEKDWETNRIAPYRRVRTGYFDKVKPEEGQSISADLIRETSETPMLIETLSNTGGSIRGQAAAGQERSGKHFQLKRNQEEKSFSYLFSNIENSTKVVGEVALAIIQNRCTTERIFRITRDVDPSVKEPYDITANQKQFALDESGKIVSRIVNDLTIGEYDIEIDTTPYSSTAREIEFQKMSELFEAAAKIDAKKADALLPLIVKMGDFPLADEILSAWGEVEGSQQYKQQALAQQQQLQQMAIQMQMIMAKLGIEQKKAVIDEIKAKAEALRVKSAHTNQHVKKEKINNALSLLQNRIPQKIQTQAMQRQAAPLIIH
ncbi:MAG: hypothetical protein WCA84_05745 [Ignavibacteriaceae bacterium]